MLNVLTESLWIVKVTEWLLKNPKRVGGREEGGKENRTEGSTDKNTKSETY